VTFTEPGESEGESEDNHTPGMRVCIHITQTDIFPAPAFNVVNIIASGKFPTANITTVQGKGLCLVWNGDEI
jgi:hypothetical protein